MATGETIAGLEPVERRRLSVVARVRPEQKVDIVEALQQEGDIVAMLGDGVNDAPALRRADIGVAAGLGGTEVAKQAADLVLMDDDLGTVIAAVEEGRRIFANIRSFLVYAVSGGLAEVGVMLGRFPGGAGAVHCCPGRSSGSTCSPTGWWGSPSVRNRPTPKRCAVPPRPPTESIFTPRSRVALAVAAITLTVTALAVGALTTGGSADRRTAVFLTLGLGQLGVALALRSNAHARRGTRGLERGVLGALHPAAGGVRAARGRPARHAGAHPVDARLDSDRLRAAGDPRATDHDPSHMMLVPSTDGLGLCLFLGRESTMEIRSTRPAEEEGHE